MRKFNTALRSISDFCKKYDKVFNYTIIALLSSNMMTLFLFYSVKDEATEYSSESNPLYYMIYNPNVMIAIAFISVITILGNLINIQNSTLGFGTDDRKLRKIIPFYIAAFTLSFAFALTFVNGIVAGKKTNAEYQHRSTLMMLDSLQKEIKKDPSKINEITKKYKDASFELYLYNRGHPLQSIKDYKEKTGKDIFQERKEKFEIDSMLNAPHVH